MSDMKLGSLPSIPSPVSGGIPLGASALNPNRFKCAVCGKGFVSEETFGLGTTPHFVLTLLGKACNVTIFNVCDDCGTLGSISEQNQDVEKLDYSKLPIFVVGIMGRPSPLTVDFRKDAQERVLKVNSLVTRLMQSFNTYLSVKNESKGVENDK